MRFIGAGGRPGQPQVDNDLVFTIPNVLTVVRFMGVPLFVWLVLSQKEYGIAIVVLAVMGSTDWVDGYIARRFNQTSRLGRIMDPIADRLALITVAVTLVIAGVVQWWYLAALVVPDAVLLALSLYYFHSHPDLPVSRAGKIRTALLLVGTPVLMLSKLPLPT
ncbi:MAG: CDP-alcohol phosphatidyltransferase family protein, partial [Arthrobacter sp.]